MEGAGKKGRKTMRILRDEGKKKKKQGRGKRDERFVRIIVRRNREDFAREETIA